MRKKSLAIRGRRFLNKTIPSRRLNAKAAMASAKTKSARKPTSVKRSCAVRPVRRKYPRKTWHTRSRRALLIKKPRAKLQRGKQARPSAYRKKPRARLQRGAQARPSRTFFCTNSGGAGHSGYHWVACIVDKATQSSVANAM